MDEDNKPMIRPRRITIAAPEGTLAGWRWENPGAPPLLFCHATGFCASTYKVMLQLLSADFDIFALDLRGHGRSDLPADPRRLRNWRPYVEDIANFLNTAGRSGWVLAGHSMGASCVLLAAQGRSDINRVALIEPVVAPRWLTALASIPFVRSLIDSYPMVRQARRRRTQWESADAALQSYERKMIFRGWADGVLADYLEDGLRCEPDGVRLSCDPDWEGATFAAQANHVGAGFRRAPAPVSILAADHPSTTFGVPAALAAQKTGATIHRISGVTHLAPMEKPQIAAQFVASRL